MKIIDEKGRLFGKINIIDLCVILVIVLAVAAFFVKSASLGKTEKSTAEITYTLKVKGVRMQTVDELNQSDGKSISVVKTGEALGTIQEVSYDQAIDFIVDKSGNYIETTIPDKYDVIVKISTNGTETPKGIYTEGGKQLFIGEDVKFNTKNAETSGEVLEIKVGN